jgi:hypothetical protein
MRVGMNPQKEYPKIILHTHHRVIIVVYIPEMTGYYQNVLEVFKLSLESILATKNDKCAVTVVNNGSCREVVDYLSGLYAQGKVDAVIHHRENVGKIDALVGAARGTREPLITLTDVDVLFKKGWQENVEEVFGKMKNAGSVSPIPVRKTMNYRTGSTLKKIMLGQVGFSLQPIPENFDDHNRFLESVNWQKETSNDKLWPVVEQHGAKAILGSSHQVMTLNREIFFTTVPSEPSFAPVSNDSEGKYIDRPVNYAGGMRLSTYHNYAYHMGNQVEDWMLAIQHENLNSPKQQAPSAPFKIAPSVFRNPSRWFALSERFFHKWFNTKYKTANL